MKRFTIPTLLVIGAAFLAACEQLPTPPELAPAEARLGKGNGNGGGGGGTSSECGGKTVLLDSRAGLDWSASAAVRGDATGDVFTGGVDGVHAKIFYHDAGCSRSGDIVFDPDMNSKRHGRHLTFYFPAGNGLGLGAEAAGAFVNFTAAMQLGSDANKDGRVDVDEGATGGRDARIEEKSAGAPRGLEHPETSAAIPGYVNRRDPERKFRFAYTGIQGCDYLEYELVSMTRTSSTDGFQPTGGTAADGLDLGAWSDTEHLGTWTIASVATANDAGVQGHWAQCWTSQGNSTVANGSPMDMPFEVAVTELR